MASPPLPRIRNFNARRLFKSDCIQRHRNDENLPRGVRLTPTDAIDFPLRLMPEKKRNKTKSGRGKSYFCGIIRQISYEEVYRHLTSINLIDDIHSQIHFARSRIIEFSHSRLYGSSNRLTLTFARSQLHGTVQF